MTNSQEADQVSDERSSARERVQAKRDLLTHLVVYVVCNAFLVAVWVLSGAGYFWPAWSLGGWGIGLALQAWSAYGERPISEADIDGELERDRIPNQSRSPETP